MNKAGRGAPCEGGRAAWALLVSAKVGFIWKMANN